MKENLVKIILFVVLIALILISIISIKRVHEKRENKALKINQEKTEDDQATEEPVRLNKQRIRNLKNKAEDNQNLPSATEMDITFSGYEEHPKSFSWMTAQEWEQFQENLKGYLKKKRLDSVTQVNLHPDSMQKINDYERYIYLDVDYKTEYSETLLIKAICDTYGENMRFAFEIQYTS